MNTRHLHACASERRPAATIEQDRQLVHAWSRDILAELPADHPRRTKLEDVRERTRHPFPVAQPAVLPPAEAHKRMAAGYKTLGLLALGNVLIVLCVFFCREGLLFTGGIAGLVGLVLEAIAFERAENSHRDWCGNE